MKHTLTVLSVLSPGQVAAEPDVGSRFVLLDGRGACPPEDNHGCDGMGNQGYANLLRQMVPGQHPSPKTLESLREAAGAKNMTSHVVQVELYVHPLLHACRHDVRGLGKGRQKSPPWDSIGRPKPAWAAPT